MVQALIGAFSQIISFFGSIIVFGLLLQGMSRFTARVYSKPFGWKAIYFLAWLGTPVHELGHAFFCILFRHKIVKIRLFEPDKITGKLGYVKHIYDKRNPIAQIGNFFIGIGPLLFGSVTLFIIFYFLVPGGSGTWSALLAAVRETTSQTQILLGDYFMLFANSAFEMLQTIFTPPNLFHWRFWVYLYLSVSIASHMGISLPDLKGMVKGLGCLFPLVYALFFFVNLLGIASGWGAEYFLPLSVSSFAVIFGIMMIALVISILGFALSYLVIATYVKLRHGYVLNPF